MINKINTKIPDVPTPEFAEFVGILLGDGYVSNLNRQICISMDGVLDKEYVIKIVRNHFVNLFGKDPCIHYPKTKRNVKCFIFSKEISTFLTDKLGLPNGRRKYNINNKIPEVFLNDETLLKNVIRGLFDTEGGFYQHNKTSPRLYIYNNSQPLLKSIYDALRKLGYNAIIKKELIKICRKGEIVKFFNEIGSSNLQKQLKYQIWLREGRVPNNDRIIKELMRL